MRDLGSFIARIEPDRAFLPRVEVSDPQKNLRVAVIRDGEYLYSLGGMSPEHGLPPFLRIVV
jgi:hypothetical protein